VRVFFVALKNEKEISFSENKLLEEDFYNDFIKTIK